MSTTSIYSLNEQKLLNDIDKLLIEYGNDQLLYMKFYVGEDTDVSKLARLVRLGDIINNNFCSLENCMPKLLETINILKIR